MWLKQRAICEVEAMAVVSLQEIEEEDKETLET